MTTQTNSPPTKSKSTKKKHQSFSPVETGTPQVPIRKAKKTNPQPELLSDWEHAS